MRRGRRGRRIPWLPLRLHWRFCSFSGGGDFLNHHTSTLPPHIQNRDSRTTTHRKFSQATTTDSHQKPRCHISKSTQQKKPPHNQIQTTTHHTSTRPPHIQNQDSKTTTHRQFSHFIFNQLQLPQSSSLSHTKGQKEAYEETRGRILSPLV